MSAAVGDVITHEGRLVVLQRLTRFAAFLFDLVEQPADAERARYGVVCAEPDRVTGRTPVDPATLSDVNRRFVADALAGGLPYRVTGRAATRPTGLLAPPRGGQTSQIGNPTDWSATAPAVTQTPPADAGGRNTLAAGLAPPRGDQTNQGDPTDGSVTAPAVERPPRAGQRKKRVVLAYRLATAAPRKAVVAAFAPTKAVVAEPLVSLDAIDDGYRAVVQYEPPNAGGSRHDVERIVARAVRRLEAGGHVVTVEPAAEPRA